MSVGMQCFINVAGENRCLKCEWQAVGTLNGFVNVVEGINTDDRPENLLLTDFRIRCRVVQNGGLILCTTWFL